jgi:probable F420-dependent oxidoreductase
MSQRHGMTIPFDGVPLADHRAWFEELVDLGYTDLWSSEANGTDAFTPLALAAAWTPSVRLGCAIVPAFTRGPALLAQSVAAMTEAAPGRFVFGIGTSSNVIVENWNAIPFEEPYKKTRDMVRFLKQALTGEKVVGEFDTFEVKGFRLGRKPPEVPPILVAALRPGMLRLAGQEADGAIINWLSADDVSKVVPEVQAGADRAADKADTADKADASPEIVARIFVCPSEDADTVRQFGRMAIAAYLNVPVYAAFHEWLGRAPALKPMWDAWAAGDRKAATAAISDEVVDELIVHGSPAACREHVARYVANGVTTPVLAVLPFGVDMRQAMRDLAPAG